MNAHVVTVECGHVIGGTDCWCKPCISVSCSQCDDDPQCWKCGGKGWVIVDAAPDDETPTVVVHHYPPEVCCSCGVTFK